MTYAGILAGGYGWDQKKEDMPKQYMLLGEKPILLHTLEQFVIHPQIEKIVIAAPSNWLIYTEDLVRSNHLEDKVLAVIEGGENKYQSILRIARYIQKQEAEDSDPVCIFHDAIRPFVTQRIIKDNLTKIQSCQAVSTVIETVDTLVVSEDRNSIKEIPDKNKLYAEQTPQTFRIKTLLQLHESIDDTVRQSTVNAFRTFLRQGHEVKMVQGEFSNIKIVTQYDLEVANALLKRKSHD